MMCCGDERGYIEPVGNCAACNGDVGLIGEATMICSYSPTMCGTCGRAPCDGSC